MSKKICILATGYGDYNLDYQRFLYNNRSYLAEQKIAYPWLDCSRHDFFWQGNLYSKFLSIKNTDSPILDELGAIMEDNERLLLSAPIGSLLDFPLFANFLRQKHSLADWRDLHISIVWLVNEYSREIEGAYRFNLPEDTAQRLYQAAIANKMQRLGGLDAFLSCADECHIIYDDPRCHISPHVFMEKLGISTRNESIKPLQQTNTDSWLSCWLKSKISALLPSSTLDTSATEQPDFTFMPPELLAEIWKLYAHDMEILCRKHGHDVKFPAPAPQPNWKPFVKPDKQVLQKAYGQALAALSVPEQEYCLRILEYSNDAAWLADDPACLAGELRRKLALAEPPEPLVCVLTLAKNHEKYIGECIESVLAQKTDFPVRHIIVDDCSTDRTPAIIEEYARKNPSIWPVFLAGSAPPGRNVSALFSRCKSEYASLCDGDDYFTDPLKLQKQVDFLRKYKECSLCFHPVDVVYEDGSPTRVYPPEDMLPGGVRNFYTLKDLFGGNMIQTNSVMYRWRFGDGLPAWFEPSLVPADWYWHLLHAETGMIGYQKERMAAYRRHSASLYASAETGHVTHRGKHGLEELRMYDVCDRHFRRRYHEYLQKLANGVFADFLKIYADSDDDSLLQTGVERFPFFAREFLAQLKIVSVRKPDVSNNK